jgi:hypothetical protein
LEHDDGLDWLPDDGVALSRRDLERIMIALRSLIDGTDSFEVNRSHVIEIAVTIAQAMDRVGL